jgi:flagellar basal body-associated protein FliL
MRMLVTLLASAYKVLLFVMLAFIILIIILPIILILYWFIYKFTFVEKKRKNKLAFEDKSIYYNQYRLIKAVLYSFNNLINNQLTYEY